MYYNIVSINHFLWIHLYFQTLWPACRNLLEPDRIYNVRRERDWTWGPGNYNIYGAKETEKKQRGGEI